MHSFPTLGQALISSTDSFLNILLDICSRTLLEECFPRSQHVILISIKGLNEIFTCTSGRPFCLSPDFKYFEVLFLYLKFEFVETHVFSNYMGPIHQSDFKIRHGCFFVMVASRHDYIITLAGDSLPAFGFSRLPFRLMLRGRSFSFGSFC